MQIGLSIQNVPNYLVSSIPTLCLHDACLHTREYKLFGLLSAQVVQNVYGRTDSFSHILCSFFRLSANTYIDHADWSRHNMICAGMSVELCGTMPIICHLMLTKSGFP